MANYSDFRDKNTKFTGTTGEKLSVGTTANRDTSLGQGTIRFNTTLGLMEYYDGTIWKSIDAPPSISGLSPTSFASDGTTLFDITITGENFSTGAIVKFIAADGTEYTSATVTRNSVTEIVAETTAAMTVAKEPFTIQITNSSGLAVTSTDTLDAGSSPAFSASAGSLGTLASYNAAATGLTTQTFGPATDADGTAIVYSISVGTLPSGLSLGTGGDLGKIAGTADTFNGTTNTFTISATDGVNVTTREFTITVAAPTSESFTSTGSGTFNVPSGVTAVDVLVVAAGGSGGSANGQNGTDGGGGGGAGGLVYAPAYPVTPGGSVSVTVGAGGAAPNGYSNSFGQSGGNSVFGSLTANGGGYASSVSGTGASGGSGGGGGYGSNGGETNQPSDGGHPTGTGYGNNGGNPNGAPTASPYSGSGGGGAGGAGGDRNGGSAGAGGAGRSYTIGDGSTPVTYAGGGGGGGGGPGSYSGAAGGSGGGGAGAPSNGHPVNDVGPSLGGQGGTTNRGGAGGGGGGQSVPNANNSGRGGSGGPGIVIVRY